jgi:hypothetical protein
MAAVVITSREGFVLAMAMHLRFVYELATGLALLALIAAWFLPARPQGALSAAR